MIPFFKADTPKTVTALNEFVECKSRATLKVVEQADGTSYLKVVKGWRAYNPFDKEKNLVLIRIFLKQNYDIVDYTLKKCLKKESKIKLIKLMKVFTCLLQSTQKLPNAIYNQKCLTKEELRDLAFEAINENNKLLFRWTVKLMGGKSVLDADLVKPATANGVMKTFSGIRSGALRCPSHLQHHFSHIKNTFFFSYRPNYDLHVAIEDSRFTFPQYIDDSYLFPDVNGNTPLMLAITKARTRVITQLLTSHRFSVFMYNSQGVSPFHLLLQTEDEDIWRIFDSSIGYNFQIYQSTLLPMLIHKNAQGTTFLEEVMENGDRRRDRVLRLLAYVIELKPSGLRLLLNSFTHDELKKDFVKLIIKEPKLLMVYVQAENQLSYQEILNLALEQQNRNVLTWLISKADSSKECKQLLANNIEKLINIFGFNNGNIVKLYIESQGIEKYLDLTLHGPYFNSRGLCNYGFASLYLNNFHNMRGESEKRLVEVVKIRILREYLIFNQFGYFKNCFAESSPEEVGDFALKNDFPELLEIVEAEDVAACISLPMIRLPSFCKYLREKHTDAFEKYIKKMGLLKDLDIESKLFLLNYLPAEEVKSAIKSLNNTRKKDMIEMPLVVEKALMLDAQGIPRDADPERTLPLVEALNYLWLHRLKKIPAETDPGAPLMVAELKNNLNKLPLDSLACLASMPEHRQVVLAFVRYFEESQLKVIIPQIGPKGLITLLKKMADGELHACLLRFATDAQKVAYLNEYPLDRLYYTDWKKKAAEFRSMLAKIEGLPTAPETDEKIVNLQSDFQEYTKDIQLLEGYSARLQRIAGALIETTTNREIHFRVSAMRDNMVSDLGSFKDSIVGEVKKDYDSLKKIYDLKVSESDETPKEFLDPITDDVMTVPLICPNTLDIVDRSTLVSQLNNPPGKYRNPYDGLSHMISAYKLDTDLVKRIQSWEAKRKGTPIQASLEAMQPPVTAREWVLSQRVIRFAGRFMQYIPDSI